MYRSVCVFFQSKEVVATVSSLSMCKSKKALLVFLRLHCELDGWVLGVQVTQELIQGLSTMWPGGKDVIYASDPEVGFPLRGL